MAPIYLDRDRRKLLRTTVGGLAIAATAPFCSLAQTRTPPSVCQLTPEQEEGPFYIAHEQFRSDVAEDRPGIPLILNLRLYNSHACQPLAGALVEIWSCDAQGLYAGFDQMPFGGPLGIAGHPSAGPGAMPPMDHPPGMPPPDGQRPMGPPPALSPGNQKTFLRGIQKSDRDGLLTFNTLYPGCYIGRVNHIHLKVRIGDDAKQANHVAHTGQMFFPEDVTTAVLAEAPYRDNKVERTLLANDMVYTGQGGGAGMLTLNQMNPSEICGGFIATAAFGIDPEATPNRVGMRNPRQS